MAEIQSFALNPEYDPLPSIDYSAKAEKKMRDDIAQLEAFQQRNQELDRQQIQDTKFVGQDLRALSELAPSVLEFGKEWAIRSKEDREIGAYVDGLFEDPEGVEGSPQEDAVIRRGLFEQKLAGEAIGNLEATGNNLAASIVSKKFKRGGGLARENALLNQAKIELPGRIETLLNDSSIQINIDGKLIPITELAADPEYASYAVRFATKLALKERGLQFASKRQFKEVLGGTLTQYMQNKNTALVSEAIRLEQTENRMLMNQGAANLGVDLANGSLLADPQVVFDALVATSRSRGLGLSPGQINSSIAQSMYAGAGSNKTAILELSRLKSGSGTIGGAYPIVLRDALQKADSLKQAEDAALADQMAKDGMVTLKALVDSGAKAADINAEKNNIRDRIAVIDPARANTFSTQAENTFIDSRQDALLRKVQEDMRAGKIYGENDLRAAGLNETNIATALTTQDITQEYNKVKPQIEDDNDGTRKSVLKGAGIKVDALGKYTIPGDRYDPILVNQALNRYEAVKEQHMRKWFERNRGDDPRQTQRDALLEARRFDEQELGPNGAFAALGELRSNQIIQDPVKREERDNAIKAELKQYVSPNSVNSIRPTRSQPRADYSHLVGDDGAVPVLVQNEWVNNGGEYSNIGIFNFKETEKHNDFYNKNGVYSDQVVKAADALGTSPAVLLNNQNRRYGLPQLKAPKVTTGPAFSTIKPSPELNRQEQLQVIPQVINQLMSPEYGLAKPAATVLAGRFALMEEKEWKATLSKFALSRTMRDALTNPNLSEKQFINKYNMFVTTYENP